MVSFLANANSTVQKASEDHIRGRVMSVYSSLFLGVTPIGSFIIGTLSESISTPLALTISASVCFLASGFFFYTSKRLRI